MLAQRCSIYSTSLTCRRAFSALLSDAVERRLETMKRRHDEIFASLQEAPTAPSSGPPSASLGKELSKLSPVVSLDQKRHALQKEMESIRDLIREAADLSDADLAQEGERELIALEAQLHKVERRILDAVIPKDDEDYGSDAVIEVRAGTGGDEASLFCAELFEAYQKTAELLRWKTEILTRSVTDIGGVREAALSVTGRPSYRMNPEDDDNEDIDNASSLLGPYGFFKFESGVHRVQRVPVNDSRIQTSACSVAVLPLEGDESSSFVIPPTELRIETMRSSGAGGQHVNTTDSAVRITHIPTGITASIQDERTQHRNKEKALKLITARVRDLQREEHDRARGEARSTLMGGGDRSERIRTYNYPQDRVTDHRSKTTRHGIEALLAGGPMDGLVATFLPDLQALRKEELLARLDK